MHELKPTRSLLQLSKLWSQTQRSASMQATKRDGKLIVVSSMANATKTTTYELSADGRQLKQTVDMSGGRLSTPIQYTNTYIR